MAWNAVPDPMVENRVPKFLLWKVRSYKTKRLTVLGKEMAVTSLFIFGLLEAQGHFHYIWPELKFARTHE